MQYYAYIYNMDFRKIYNRIAILRHERRLSRKELADRVGVNYQTIGYLEREEYNPSLDLAFRPPKLSNGLPSEISSLCGEKERWLARRKQPRQAGREKVKP